MDTQTDCRTEHGVTVGLIDALITLCRLLKNRDVDFLEAKEALKDLASDEDFDYLNELVSLRELDALRDFKSRVEQIVHGFDDYADRVDRNNRLEIMETALRDLASMEQS